MIGSLPLNPYVVGGALGDPTGRGFFGREDIFTFVRSALNAEQRSPIILYGHRRIGKSSVLKQLPRVLPPELITVFFDLQGKASMELDQVLYGLGRAIADRLEIARPTGEETTEETFAKEFLVRAVRAIENCAERLVLLFDEFDVVDERLDDKNVASHRFIGYLGDLISREPRFGYILVVGRKTTELSEEFNSSLLKNSVRKQIGRLSREEADRLVQAPSQNYLKFTDSALEKIYKLASGHPFCTQLLCLTIWSAKMSKSVSSLVEVTKSDVDDALLPALEYGTNGMNWIFDGLINPAHRLFVSALAQAVDPTSGELASFSMIENVLASKKVTIDTVEMNNAPNGGIITWMSIGYGAGKTIL